MRSRLATLEARVLPLDRLDVLRQLSMFGAAYGCYEVVRAFARASGDRPFTDATRIIDLERALHVFVEPQIEAWATHRAHWLLVIADWTYVNAHFTVTAAALVFIYTRRNSFFWYVRNMFLVAMALALVGYALYPTAPPWLMPAWGFTDPVGQFTGIAAPHGPASVLLNPYAAVPSMHVCFAAMIGVTMSRLVRGPVARVLWGLYPVFITFVVVATGNHYFTDVVLGLLTAAAAAFIAKRLLAPYSYAPQPWPSPTRGGRARVAAAAHAASGAGAPGRPPRS